MEIFKQDQYNPVSVDKQTLIYFAITSGLLDDVPVEKVGEFEQGLYKYADTSGDKIMKEITAKKELSEKLEQRMKKLIEDYKSALDYLIKEEKD